MIKLSKFARDLGVHKVTLYNWQKQGKIKFHKIGSMNFIDTDTYNEFLGIKKQKVERVVVYCRVSSSVNRSNLLAQQQRVESYCIARGYQIHDSIIETGSGLNDNRTKLNKLFLSGDYTRIVVEHRDRLCRSGFNLIESLVKATGKEIEVINNVTEAESDIVQDFVSIITSYCARIYGHRRSKRKTIELIEKLKEN